MIPKKKRGNRLDDLLRALGFHARRCGSYGRDSRGSLSATIHRNRKTNAARDGLPEGDELISGGREELMARRVEATRKRRPQDTGTSSMGR